MMTRPDPTAPARRTARPRGFLLSAAFLASGLLALSFPIDAAGPHGGSSAGSRGGGSGGRSSFSGGGRSSFGGSRSYSAAPRSSSGGRSYASGGTRGGSGGTRSSTSGWRGWSSSSTSSTPVRSASGDRAYGSPGTAGGWGTHSVTATGTRGGSGGPPPSGGHPGGNPGGNPGSGHSGGGSHGGGSHGGGYHGGSYHGGYHGWYCPPVYWAGASWYWGGPWDWWGWGWGPYGGYGWGWGWGGGVYVINDGGQPAADRYARIDTDVSPEAAEVYLDGTYIGSADDFDGYPDYLYLAPGKYRLEFRHPFYDTVVKDLDVQAGQSLQFDDEMKLLPGKKKLEVVDPKERGTPLGRVFGRPEAKAEGQRDRTGRFDAEGSMDSGGAGEIRATDVDVLPPAVAPEGGTVTPPQEVAPAERGRLRFEVEPEDAVVYVDDRYAGTGEELAGLRRGLPVKPGKHTVTVARPGFKSKTIDVEARPGSAIDVVIELEK